MPTKPGTPSNPIAPPYQQSMSDCITFSHQEGEEFLCVVVHEKLHRVQAEQHLARAVARGHVEEELQGLRHHLVVIRPILEVVPNLSREKQKKRKQEATTKRTAFFFSSRHIKRREKQSQKKRTHKKYCEGKEQTTEEGPAQKEPMTIRQELWPQSDAHKPPPLASPKQKHPLERHSLFNPQLTPPPTPPRLPPKPPTTNTFPPKPPSLSSPSLFPSSIIPLSPGNHRHHFPPSARTTTARLCNLSQINPNYHHSRLLEMGGIPDAITTCRHITAILV